MADKTLPGLSLAQLIKSTAAQLREAKDPDVDPVIELTECSLELSVSASADAKGGLKFWLIDAGASVSGETVSKVNLKFKPVGEQQYYNDDLDEKSGGDGATRRKRR